MNLNFPLLNADQIEVKVKQVTQKGIVLLLYKTARTDMELLDAIVGPMNWAVDYREIKENLYCGIGITEDGNRWVWKWDCGVESRADGDGNEKKGEASDAFKRAGFKWGIGRELYTSPFVWVTAANASITGDNGRYKTYDTFEVQEIGYDDKHKINRLVIVNTKTRNVVYQFGSPSDGGKAPRKPSSRAAKGTEGKEDKAAEKATPGPQMATEKQKEYIRTYASDADYEQIMSDYGAELENLTKEAAEEAIVMIDVHNTKTETDAPPTCERCQKIITGIVLPDKSTMTASQLIGKSKLTYGGIYCFDCMKALKEKKAG